MIFLHRQGSLQPFIRNFPSHEVLDLLQLKDLPDGSSQLEGTRSTNIESQGFTVHDSDL